MLTFAVILIPWIDTVLNPIAHQGVVNTHVAVAEERIGRTRSCRQETNRQNEI